jgi:hypothetical protein
MPANGSDAERAALAVVLCQEHLDDWRLEALLSLYDASAEGAEVLSLRDPSWPILLRAAGPGDAAVVVSREGDGDSIALAMELLRARHAIRVCVSSAQLGPMAERVANLAGWHEGEVQELSRARLSAAVDVVEESPGVGRAVATAEPTGEEVLVDVGRYNPVGFLRASQHAFAVLDLGTVSGDAWRDVLVAARELVGRTDVHPLRNELAAGGVDPELLEVLRAYRGVIDHPRLHESAQSHASTVLSLAAAGIPLLALDLPHSVEELLGERLVEVLREAAPALLADEEGRERHSVRLRRLALREHLTGTGSRLTRACRHLTVPPLTVMLATRRPEFLAHALRQVGQQDYPDRELVVALHADDFPPDTAARVREFTSGPVQLIDVDPALTLGEALNACLKASAGVLVTKMDDDDWYGSEHLSDLALAHAYSGADLVGKGAEFVYLAEEDITIRRFVGSSERMNPTVAGGALCVSRDWLREIGGFVRASLGEDRSLVEETTTVGGLVYRTHGYGYVLHRHGRHAWEVPTDYFKDAAVATHPGLASDQALV